MLLINCPWCGERDETEFSYGGEAHIERPKEPNKLSDQEWADYLFMRTNTKGIFLERWNHAFGCRRWFNAARNTVTHEILAIYKMGEHYEPQQTMSKAPETSSDEVIVEQASEVPNDEVNQDSAS